MTSTVTGMRIHLRFHISFLEPASKNTKLGTYIETEDNIIKYIIKEILDYRDNIGEEEYLIKWKDYDISENI